MGTEQSGLIGEVVHAAEMHGASDEVCTAIWRALESLLGVGRPAASVSTLELEPPSAPSAIAPSAVAPAGGAPTVGGALALPEGGRYEALSWLGAGTMGEVWRVRDHELGRTLAMKVIQRRHMVAPRVVRRFVEEARVVSQLQHPNILPIHELSRLPDGRWYFTMREVHGRDMAEVLAASPEDPDWSFRRLVDAFARICEAIGHAHARGVMHRDIKPANVMLGARGEVLVVDWGLFGLRDAGGRLQAAEPITLERDEADATSAGAILGTPYWMAPEQLMGAAGLRSDVYSLGGVLYQLLMGRPPYQGLDKDGIYARLRAGEASEAPDAGPEELRAICRKAMAWEPDERYADASEVAAAVVSWQDGVKRREAALERLALARAAEGAAAAAQEAAEEHWGAAEKALEGGASAECWESRRAADELWQQAKQESAKVSAQLQGALAYDPELPEVHERIAQTLLVRCRQARVRRDALDENFLARRVASHLEHLPAVTSAALRTELGRPVHPIEVLRAQGVNFVGRLALRRTLAKELAVNRLVTLVGTAGVGKTRLALEVAWEQLDVWSGIVLCELSEATDMLGILQGVGRALDVSLTERDPVDQLGHALRDRGAFLLVLDNLEQVAEPVAEVLERWLRVAPELTVLATSRRALKVAAEITVEVDCLSRLEAMELFARYGHAARSSFTMTPENRDLLAELVERLDRLPLALELAAARLSGLRLTVLSKRLEELFPLLQDRIRDPRARTLEKAIAWSWSLLPDWGQAALAQCSVFRGGFELVAAEAVIDLSPWPQAPPALDVLEMLRDDSLIKERHDSNDRARYSLLNAVRAFSEVRLMEGETVERHATYYAEFCAQPTLDALKREGGAARMSRFTDELENLVVVTERFADSLGLRCCLGVAQIIERRGPFLKAKRIIDGLLEQQSGLPIERAHALLALGRLERLIGSPDSAQRSFKAAMQLFVEARHRGAEGAALNNIGNLHVESGNVVEAERSQGEALKISRDIGNAVLEAKTLNSLSVMWRVRGDYDKSYSTAAQAFGIYRDLGERYYMASVLNNIGTVYRIRSELTLAEENYSAAMEIYDEFGNVGNVAILYLNIGNIRYNTGRLVEAREYYNKSLKLFREIGSRRGEGLVLPNLGGLCSNMGDMKQAMSLMLEAVDVLKEKGNKQNMAVLYQNIGVISVSQGRVDDGLFYYNKSLELYRAMKNRSSEGLVLSVMGVAYEKKGRFEESMRSYERALEIHKESKTRREEGVTRGYIGVLYLRMGDLIESRRSYERALEIHREVGDRRSEGMALSNLGEVHRLAGRLDESGELLAQGEAILLELGDTIILGELVCQKGQLALSKGERGRASGFCEEAEALRKRAHSAGAGELGQAVAALRSAIVRDSGVREV